jgi:hypothetical protein
MSDIEFTRKEKELGFDKFKTTIKAAISKQIDYDKYHFVIDEDGDLYFLKRPKGHKISPERKKHGYNGGWPCNSYDGNVLWVISCSSSSVDVITMFLEAIEAKYLL